jgi:hypothetical protein
MGPAFFRHFCNLEDELNTLPEKAMSNSNIIISNLLFQFIKGS